MRRPVITMSPSYRGTGTKFKPGLLTLKSVLPTIPRRLSFHLIHELESNSKRIHNHWLFMCVLLLMVCLVLPCGRSFSHVGLGCGQGISQSGRQDLALLGQGRPPAGGGLP